MKHEFVILRNGVLETYDKYEDIPESFDNLIKFLPYVPEEEHGHETEHEHELIAEWNEKLKELLKRETK
jgi:hypothetical protein